MARICVVGQGYVGLVTAAGLAELGNDVVGLDVDAAKIERLLADEIPIYEPGLETIVARNRAAGRLTFTTDHGRAVPGADMLFLALPTPEGRGGEPDLRCMRAAVATCAAMLRDDAIVVVKSTVPPGTGDRVEAWIGHARGQPACVVSHPEFLREGSAIEDFFQPDRVVVGSPDRATAETVAALYARLRCPTLIVDRRTAELIKYASNAFLATRISFINEIARICERIGVDVKDVAKGMGLDRRIGPRFLEAGIGYGGSCFPKDVKALERLATSHGGHPQLLRSVTEINRDQRLAVARSLSSLLGGLSGRTIGLLGLAFKPNTDDLRGAPALELAEILAAEGAQVVAFDPVAMQAAAKVMPEVICCPDAYTVAAMSDALVVVTDWPEFRQLDLPHLRDLMGSPIVVDGRNIYEPAGMRELGFVYLGIGRGSDAPAAPGRIDPLEAPRPLAAA
ncbi:MAG TPA: UDP-glucose/GDP-mannose dehydrogenase family protein [Chloroflexota bacterium]